MKKALFLVCMSIVTISSVFAQNAKRKYFTVPCLMPNGSNQLLWIQATQSDANEFISIASRNKKNMSPIKLSEKIYKESDQTFLNESTLYRFLANQLCETCNVEKVLTKKDGGCFFLKNNSGKYFIDVFFVDKYKKWFLNIVNLNEFTITVEAQRPLFYL